MRLGPNDLVLFTNGEKTLMRRLQIGGRLETSWGRLEPEAVVNCLPGTMFTTSKGRECYVFRPTLMDYVMNMPRKSGIIYPKDAAVILMWVDVFPGARVLLGGVGSGALLLMALRQVGEKGYILALDLREDMLKWAADNVVGWYGVVPSFLQLRQGDVCRRLPPQEEGTFDRVLLDIPDPWRAVAAVHGALTAGGIFCAYVPSVTQALRLVNVLKASRAFTLIETIEILLRSWYLTGVVARPQHRMVGHTGFLVFARKLDRKPEEEAMAAAVSIPDPGEPYGLWDGLLGINEEDEGAGNVGQDGEKESDLRC